jgi:RHS repeat-associated protein
VSLFLHQKTLPPLLSRWQLEFKQRRNAALSPSCAPLPCRLAASSSVHASLGRFGRCHQLAQRIEEYCDQDAELLYLTARWYDPKIGRFISADPFEGKQQDPRSFNRCSYSHGDPVHSTDASGQMTLGETMTTLNNISMAYTPASIAFDVATGNYVGAAEDIATELIGIRKPGGSQAHHIVGAVTDSGRATRDKLLAHNMSVNSPANGVFLPGCGPTTNVIGMIHCGKHTEAYELAVYERINHLNKREDIISALDDIRRELLSNNFVALNVRSLQ